MAKTDAKVVCACGKECSAMGIKSHERNCQIAKDIAAANDALKSSPPPPPAPLPPSSVANAVNAARGNLPNGAPPASIGEETQQPAMTVVSADGTINDDKPPLRPAEKLDELSIRLGAHVFQAGTANRWDWCREGVNAGIRHTFSRWYPPASGTPRNVLVDVYAQRQKSYVAESAHKAAQIVAHNAKLDPADHWGYVAFIKSEGQPSDTDVARVLAGECVPLAATKPVRAFQPVVPVGLPDA